MEDKLSTQSDHDLLIRVDANLQNLINDMKLMSKAYEDKQADHELRIHRVELWGGIAIGFSYALQFYLSYIK